MKRFKINPKSPTQLEAIQTRRISISALSYNQSNNLNENKFKDNCATDVTGSQGISSAIDTEAFQRTSSVTDMKRSQGISSAINTEAFRRISSAADMKAESAKRDKVEKGAYYGTREEWTTDKKNEEEEAVDFEIEYDTRNKSKKKQGASNRIMKVIQLEDEPLLPTHCRIKKVTELEEGVPNITTLITEEHQSQDVKQKQPLKS